MQWAEIGLPQEKTFPGKARRLRSVRPPEDRLRPSTLGWSSGAILFVEEMSSELGVRDLASRCLVRNVHRRGAVSAPNSDRDDVPSLGRSTVKAICGSVTP